MIRVLSDSQVYAGQTTGGISRLFAELYREYVQPHHGVTMKVPAFWFGDNVYAAECGMPQRAFFTRRYFRGKGRLQQAIARATSARALKSPNWDVFHPMYYDPYFIHHLGNRPFVVTVLDMIHELYAETHFATDRNTTANKRLLVERAARVIAISQTTKDDLVRLFGVNPEKVDVVYLADSMGDTTTTSSTPDPPEEPVLLFVGQRGAYKNFPVFARAVAEVARSRCDIQALCVGGGPFTREERTLLESLGVAERFSQRFLSEPDLKRAYSNASLFVFPSKYEGFGIPLLEAFACGCPVIASDIPVFREVAGTAALFFDAHDYHALAQRITRVLEDCTTREQLIHAGFERRKYFTWQRCAAETARVYRRAIDGVL